MDFRGSHSGTSSCRCFATHSNAPEQKNRKTNYLTKNTEMISFIWCILFKGFVNQCQPRSHWSPPPMSCCSPSDSLKAIRSSEDTSRLSWKSVSPLTKVSVWLYGWLWSWGPFIFPIHRVYEYDSITRWPRWCWSNNQSVLPQPVAPSVLLHLDVSGTAPNQKLFLMCSNIIHSIHVTNGCLCVRCPAVLLVWLSGSRTTC